LVNNLQRISLGFCMLVSRQVSYAVFKKVEFIFFKLGRAVKTQMSVARTSASSLNSPMSDHTVFIVDNSSDEFENISIV
jgi:hypothetical protein